MTCKHEYRPIADRMAYDLARVIIQHDEASGGDREYYADRIDREFRKLAEVLGYEVQPAASQDRGDSPFPRTAA